MTTYTHEQLQGMQRRDIQALAKKYEVKANGKTTDIIADLLEAFKTGKESTSSAQGSPKASPASSPKTKAAAAKSDTAESRSRSPSPSAASPKVGSLSPMKSKSRSPSPAKTSSPENRQRSPSPKLGESSKSPSSPVKSPKKIPAALADEIKEASVNRPTIPALPKPSEELQSIHKELKRKADQLSPNGGSPKKVARSTSPERTSDGVAN